MTKPSEVKNTEILKAIVVLTQELGYPPSFKEVSDRVGFRSTSSIQERLYVLRRQKRVCWSSGRQRTLKVVE